MDRREFIKTGLVASAAAVSFGGSFMRTARASHHPELRTDVGPYGPLSTTPDARGFRLPIGFTTREIARAGSLVPGTLYPWHLFPDGGATFATPDGGWIYACNSEAPVGGVAGTGGGAGAIRFRANGEIEDAYRILAGTASNCAGGPTPWGTWLSCEEHEAGRVWECDPTGHAPAVSRDAMGIFTHEAAAVDPVERHVYMTEDRSDGRFYRFAYLNEADLSAGVLQVAEADVHGDVIWHDLPGPGIPFVQPTRTQIADSTRFNGGEGCWFDAGPRLVYFTTKGDNRVWEYDVEAARLSVLHEPLLFNSPLSGVDNIIVSRSGDIFVCEDGGNLEIVLITPDGVITPFLHLVGQSGTELTGAAFDPSGTRMYFSSQRGNRIGITYEVAGPFRASA